MDESGFKVLISAFLGNYPALEDRPPGWRACWTIARDCLRTFALSAMRLRSAENSIAKGRSLVSLAGSQMLLQCCFDEDGPVVDGWPKAGARNLGLPASKVEL